MTIWSGSSRPASAWRRWQFSGRPNERIVANPPANNKLFTWQTAARRRSRILATDFSVSRASVCISVTVASLKARSVLERVPLSLISPREKPRARYRIIIDSVWITIAPYITPHPSITDHRLFLDSGNRRAGYLTRRDCERYLADNNNLRLTPMTEA